MQVAWGMRNARRLHGDILGSRSMSVEINISRIAPGDRMVSFDWEIDGPVERSASTIYRVYCEPIPSTANQERAVRVIPQQLAMEGQCDGRLSVTCRVDGLKNGQDYALQVQITAAEGLSISSPVRLVRPGLIPGSVVNYIHPDDYCFSWSGRSPASPSIAQLSDGTIVVSHDVYWGGAGQNLTKLFSSVDGGRSFQFLSDIFPCFWGNLFMHRGALYLAGMNQEYGSLLIGRSDDGGRNWSEPTTIMTGGHRDIGGPHKAPMPVVEHSGRLWTVIDHGSWNSGGHATGVVSCPVEADLLDHRNWVVSGFLPYDAQWPGSVRGGKLPNFLEGNVVVDPAGRLVVISRYQTQGASPAHGLVPVLTLDAAQPAAAPQFERYVPFIGNASKFAIRRDPVSGDYFSLTNRVNSANDSQRNILSLIRSKTLYEWVFITDVLNYENRNWLAGETPEDSTKVGFQYVDWLFSDDDLIVASRTALNNAYNFHNANQITFHRVPDFRRLQPAKMT